MVTRLSTSIVYNIAPSPYLRRGEQGGGGDDDPTDALVDSEGFIVMDKQGNYIIPKQM